MKRSARYLFGAAVILGILVANDSQAVSKPIAAGLKFDTNNQTIQGQSGGPINSKGCGFIAASPNYVIDLPQRIDYMRLSVQATGGQPTLLIVGPQAEDSFCVLGGGVGGFQPEISGVWEPGQYSIYVGDRTGDRYQFTLTISTK